MGSAYRFIPVPQMDYSIGRAAELDSRLSHHVEHRLDVGGRAGDDFEDVGIGCLSFQRRLGGIARHTDLSLSLLALGNVGINYYRAATGNWIAPYLDYPSVRARALGRPRCAGAL